MLAIIPKTRSKPLVWLTALDWKNQSDRNHDRKAPRCLSAENAMDPGIEHIITSAARVRLQLDGHLLRVANFKDEIAAIALLATALLHLALNTGSVLALATEGRLNHVISGPVPSCEATPRHPLAADSPLWVRHVHYILIRDRHPRRRCKAS